MIMSRGQETASVILLALVFAGMLKATGACAGETPIYGPDGKYRGSVFDYGKTQTYSDRNGRFTGSSINNGNGTTSYFGRNGNFQGSSGSSIDRTFNFRK
jgi:hypothetical protein